MKLFRVIWLRMTSSSWSRHHVKVIDNLICKMSFFTERYGFKNHHDDVLECHIIAIRNVSVFLLHHCISIRFLQLWSSTHHPYFRNQIFIRSHDNYNCEWSTLFVVFWNSFQDWTKVCSCKSAFLTKRIVKMTMIHYLKLFCLKDFRF